MPTGGGGTSGKDEGMKDLKPMLLTNNQRKMYGLPLWRKKNRKKRIYTRCEADETMFEVYVMKGTIAHGVLRTGSKEEAKKLTEKLLKKGEDAFWERIA